MISKQTAYDIWIVYDEIEKGKKLLAEMKEASARGEEHNLRDSFGRPRPLTLGVPSGERAHQLFDVQPSLAVEVIRVHIQAKQAARNVLMQRAEFELRQTDPIEPMV